MVVRTLVVIASPLTIRGGVAQYWKRLSLALEAKNVSTHFLTGHAQLDGRSIPALRMRPRPILWSLFDLPTILDDLNPDVVITSMPQSDILFGLLARKRASRPWVVFVQGLPYPVKGQAGRLKVAVWRALWRFAVRRASAVVAVSEATRVHVPQGVRSTVIPPLPAEFEMKDRLTRDSISTVGYVGRMSPEKDPGLFGQIAAAHTSAAFVAYGEGALLSELRETHAAVRWMGGTSTQDAFSSLDVLLLTSQSEGLPLVLLEAAAFGVLPLACDVGGVSEAIHPANRELLLIANDARSDVSEWSRRLAVLEDRGTRENAIALQREWLRNRFSSKQIRDDVVDFLSGAS